MKKIILTTACVILIILTFGLTIYPTLYRYERIKLYGGIEKLCKINRVTNKVKHINLR